MNRFLTLFVFLSISAVPALAQSEITPYHQRNDFLLASSGGLKYGLYGYDNPALLSYLHQPDLFISWNDGSDPTHRWGLFAAVPHAGFGMVRQSIGGVTVSDYQLSFAGGDRTFSTGISYAWTSTDNPLLDKSSLLTLGTLFRPSPFVSAGFSYVSAINTKGYELIGDFAFRPFGDEQCTAFADYIIHRTPHLEKDMWSAGVVVEAMPGIRITGRYFNTDAFTLGAQISLGRIGFETQAHYNGNQRYAYNSYGIRLGAYDRNIIDTYFAEKNKFIELTQPGQVKYRKYILFDKSQVLIDLLAAIDAAKNDPSAAGIAINTSGLEINAELAWELREKFADFKTTGKKVFIFIDRGGIDLYHFASVADRIVMDPFGTISLEGYLMGRTFYKGTLEKIGIGYDEWRYFKYKSASENLSLDKMSDADREQRLKIIQDWYSIARSDIQKARNISEAQFDTLVNSKVVFLAQQAKEQKLIDSIGRWDIVKDLVKQETGNSESFISARELAPFNRPYDHRWGEPPQIAVIYALGACAMDEGITARSLVKDFQDAVDDPHVKAIVLRVDSPGGDVLASDYIGEAMRKAKGKKPIIVSQGSVAASGGYWISMYADTIVAAPRTITGSIGVIGGWFYNKELKEKLGMSTDFVHIGAHADIGYGMTLPLIGIRVPDRNLTPEERAYAESAIKSLYSDFVGKVALGRKKPIDHIESIAQGRVWSGIDGKQNGLVDVLGGLETAIQIAKERAGISKAEEVTIVELPRRRLIDFSMFMPKLFGVETKTVSDPAIELLKFRLNHNGEPLPLLPMEEMDMIGQSPRE